MPPSTRCLRLVMILAVLVSYSALAHAEIKERSFEIGVLPTFVHLDTQAGLTNKVAPTFLFGYFFTKRHGAELLYTRLGTWGEGAPIVDTDVDMWRLGYTFNASHKEKVSSFFRFGFGRWAINPDNVRGTPERLQSGDRNMMIYTGGGFRFRVTDLIGVRVAATVDLIDAFNGILNADIQATGEVGISIRFGGRGTSAEPAEQPAPPKEEEKKPEDQKKP